MEQKEIEEYINRTYPIVSKFINEVVSTTTFGKFLAIDVHLVRTIYCDPCDPEITLSFKLPVYLNYDKDSPYLIGCNYRLNHIEIEYHDNSFIFYWSGKINTELNKGVSDFFKRECKAMCNSFTFKINTKPIQYFIN